jgi:hypothetical protein
LTTKARTHVTPILTPLAIVFAVVKSVGWIDYVGRV